MSTTTNSRTGKTSTNSPSSRAQRRAQEERQAKQRKLIFLAAAVALALTVVVGLILLNRDNGSNELPAITASTQIDASIPQDGRTLGNPDAPVTLIEYADFQCPYCGIFSSTIMPNLIQDYILTGQVKFEARDMSFLDDRVSDYGESDMAAEAAACAVDQGMYWQYRETLFANQHGENVGSFTRDRLIEAAKVVGLDVDTFTTCFDNRTHTGDVQTMADEATQAGVTQTPTLFLNGTKINYTGDYNDLKAQIDATLAK